jgi:subtilisin family serine protease
MTRKVKEMEKYIVLRNTQKVGWNNPFEVPVRGAGVGAAAAFPPEPKIETESVDQAGREELLRDPQVAAVTPEIPTRFIEPINKSKAGQGDAWGIGAVRADSSPFTGQGVVVAVLDTGIDTNHAAFKEVKITEYDFTGSGNGDHQGHGTHCAGTIFGRDVNGSRIGIARGVETALIGKVLDDNGGGGSEMLFRGLTWASENGANVISMSLGFDFPGRVKAMVDSGWPADLATSSTLEAYRGNVRMFDAVMDMVRLREAFGHSAVVVAASGNESRRQVNKNYVIAASLPAAATGVVSVGAASQSAGRKYDIAPFSNIFPVVSAPGVDITSAKMGGGLTTMSGTSMACPHVAGVAALWWEALRSQNISDSAVTVSAKIIASAKPNVFVKTVTPPDRGSGLITAPS